MGHIISVIWFLTGMFFGSCNDIWVKLLAHVPSCEISCFRFLFSLLSLVPFIINNKNLLKSNCKKIHFFKGVLFFFAITLWELGVKNTMLSVATLIGFSSPFFLLILSAIVLKEKTNIYQIFATTISFLFVIGIIDFKSFSLDPSFLVLIISSLFFSITDVLNKKYSIADNHITAVIYYNIFAFLVSIPFTLYNFIIPSFLDIFYMICLGLEANIYSYALLKAFSTSDASFLSPFKYFEFVFSVILGYLVFEEIPTNYCLFVMVVIIVSNYILLLNEKRKK